MTRRKCAKKMWGRTRHSLGEENWGLPGPGIGDAGGGGINPGHVCAPYPWGGKGQGGLKAGCPEEKPRNPVPGNWERSLGAG